MNFVNPGYLSTLYKRYKYRKSENISKWGATQKTANETFENPTFTIDTVSANMMNILQITSFFAILIPLGLLFSLIFFVCNYWIYKVRFI